MVWQAHSLWLEPNDLSSVLWALATLSYPVSRTVELWRSFSAAGLHNANWTISELRMLFMAYLSSSSCAPPDLRLKLEQIVEGCGLLPKMRAVGLAVPNGTLATRKDVSACLARCLVCLS